MQIRLKPYPKNIYQVNGLLILGETAQEWIAAINLLNVDLQQVQTYAVPGLRANTLYGCVLFFNGAPLPKDIRNHQYLQYAENKFLLPEKSIFMPAVDDGELKILEPEKKILLHPVVGCVVLDEPVDWKVLLEFKAATPFESGKPVTGVYIPGNIYSYTLELSDEKLINELLNPPSEKEVLDNLPFDVKKLMKGNKKEMEKYLKYLEAHPDKALNLALPLDTLGSFRGDNRGRFSFSGSWIQRLFGGNRNYSDGGGNSNTGSGAGNSWWIGLAGIAVIKIMTCNPTRKPDMEFSPKTTISFAKHESVLDSHYRSIMSSKTIALFTRLRNSNDSPGKISEYYREESKMINEEGKKIKDSLADMYTVIVKNKTDSAVKAWKKIAADSIRKVAGNSGLQNKLKAATLSKKEAVYRDYALYYGIIQDSTERIEELVEKAPQAKKNAGEKKSFGFMLLLAGILTGLSLLLARWKGGQAAERKTGTVFGGVSLGNALVLLAIMTASVIYILKPLIEIYGLSWLSIAVCLVLVLLLSRLFRGD